MLTPDSDTVKKYGTDAGAAVVGIAASADFHAAPQGCKPTDSLENCRSVIVLGIPMPREILERGDTAAYTACRNAMLAKITDIATTVAKRANAAGHKAKAIAATAGKSVGGEYFGHISLKHAAELAGLGVIGRNQLLINPEHGTLLWLSAVLTDAALTPDVKTGHAVCADCGKCVRACPSKALADPAAFGKKGCAKFFTTTGGKLEIKCFACRKVCPHRFGINAK